MLHYCSATISCSITHVKPEVQFYPGEKKTEKKL